MDLIECEVLLGSTFSFEFDCSGMLSNEYSAWYSRMLESFGILLFLVMFH